MPNKKKKAAKTGISVYCQEVVIPRVRAQGGTISNGMAGAILIALPEWKALSEQEKRRYDQKAKDEKKRDKKAEDADKTRLDNQGNVIAYRVDPDEEERVRRSRERRIAASLWPDVEDIIDFPFYMISFQYLCETDKKEFLPVEVGLIEWSMTQGISNTFHRFIDPGGVPLGYRHACQSHSQDTHQIPVDGFEQADNNYRAIWLAIEKFIKGNDRSRDFPPIYCLYKGDSVEYDIVECCMRWLHQQSGLGSTNCLTKIFALEDCVEDLYALQDQRIANHSVIDMLSTSAFDYEANTRCPYHEEIGVKDCALGTVKRYAFALSDALASGVYDFELTPNHLPVQDSSKPAYNIIPPSAIHIEPAPPLRNRIDYPGKSRADGPYAARDIRYRDTDDDATSVRSGYSGLTNGDSDAYSTGGLPRPPPAGPWAAMTAAAAQATPAPSIISEDEFPSLGARSKFAGRASAPDPSELPRPVGWQGGPQRPVPGQFHPPTQRLPNTFSQAAPPQARRQPPQSQPPQRTLSEAVAESQGLSSQRTLRQAVEEVERSVKPPSQPPMVPLGRGMSRQRAVNAGGFNPGGAPRAVNTSFNPNSQVPQRGSQPTLAEAVQQQQSARAQSQSTALMVKGEQSVMAWNPPSVYGGEGYSLNGSASNENIPPRPQPVSVGGAAKGWGRGRGAPRVASGGPGMKAPPGTRPPPGFGRGMS